MGLTLQLFLRFTRTWVISVSFSSLSTIVRKWKSLIYLDNLVLSTELVMLIMLGGGGGGRGERRFCRKYAKLCKGYLKRPGL